MGYVCVAEKEDCHCPNCSAYEQKILTMAKNNKRFLLSLSVLPAGMLLMVLFGKTTIGSIGAIIAIFGAIAMVFYGVEITS